MAAGIFRWKTVCRSAYQQKNEWSIFLQSLNRPLYLQQSILDYEGHLEDLAKSWLNSIDSSKIDTDHSLYKSTLLNQVGDPSYIYKALTNINANSLKDSFNFHKFANDKLLVFLLKEVIKSYKFLSILDGRKR